MRIAACITLLFTAAALATGCGGSSSSSASATPSQDVGEFFKQRIQYEIDGQYGRSWDVLHPGQQKIVSRSTYGDCRRQQVSPAGGVALKAVKVKKMSEEAIDLPGVPEKKAKAVTLLLTYSQGSLEQSRTATYHTVPVDGHWVWMLPADDIRAYQNGTCPM